MAKRGTKYRFEMPYQVDAPILTDPGVGIDRLVMRGNRDTPMLTLTLLDTTDERLSWAGVLLAHQVIGESGQWLLKAPEWQPWLPGERFQPLDDGDELPEEFAELLRPFRRRATIGPVAGLRVERASYVLLDAQSTELGTLQDDRVTVRRGGLAVSRQREVSFEPDPAMTNSQRALVIDRLNQAGGVRVASFPDPVERLAGLIHPLSLPSSPPRPAELLPEEFLEWLLAGRLLSVLRADLKVRKAEVDQTGPLTAELSELVEVVRGLDALVDPVWAGELRWQVERVTSQPELSPISGLGDAYFDALDTLAAAARAPRLRPDLVEASGESPATARDLLRADAAQQVAELITMIDALTPTSPDADWNGAVETAEALLRVLTAGEAILGKVRQRRRRVVKILAGLGRTINPVAEPDAASLAELDAAAAYQLGRAYQQSLAEVAEPRTKLLADWPRTREKLLADWPEVTSPDSEPTQLTAPADRPELTAAVAREGEDD